MNTRHEPSRLPSPRPPPAGLRSVSSATSAVLAFGAGALVSFASLVALGSLGLFKAWLVLSVLVLVGCLVALLARRARLRPVALAGGWLTVPAFLFVLFGWMAGTLFDGLPSNPFDRALWIAADAADHTDRTRLGMVKDLRSSGRLDRLTPGEALILLGPPDGQHWGGDGRVRVWRIGPALIDDLWLALRFGPDGRVESHRIVED